MARKFHLVSTAPEGTLLPKRSTKHSAGYDFFSPIDAEIMPGATLNIRTDIKVEMNEDEVLLILPRSSYGYKYQMSLVTTVSVIDADYFDNESNEGNIAIKIKNNGTEPLYLTKDEAFAQGIFVKYLTTDDDVVTEVRTGGIGSTTKN